jgi:protein TonB
MPILFIQRLVLGMIGSAGITFGLFVLMAYLIKPDLRPPIESKRISIQISMVEPDDDVNTIIRKLPKKIEPPKTPPPPRNRRVAKARKPDMSLSNFKIDNIDVSAAGKGIYLGPTAGSSMSDGKAIPMVTINPRYPRKAAMEGIEGWVKFKFTIQADGTPTDVELLDAKPRRIFERAARRAIYKWKFKPQVIDGKKVEQKNMIYTMEFKLGEN